MDISIVALTWNSEKYVRTFLDSLLAELADSHYVYELFIIDKGSNDNTVAVIDEYKKQHNQIKTIYLSENVGTTKSRNMALKQCTGKYICIIDSDVEVNIGAFRPLIEELEADTSIGMVVPKILYPSGKWQKSVDQFPTVQHKLNRFLRLRTIEDKQGDELLDSAKNQFVDYAISAFWLFKKDILDTVGCLDENYFYAPEDVDYCLNIWKKGYTIKYVPSVAVIHHTQEISRGLKFNRAKKEHIKGLFYYFCKHGYIFKKPNFKTNI